MPFHTLPLFIFVPPCGPKRRETWARTQLAELLTERLIAITEQRLDRGFTGAVQDVAQRTTDPYSATERLLTALLRPELL